MGFRFSKRIKIAKGLSLNLSKSGLGLSIGGRGASTAFGPRGLSAGVGIPGSGLSYRKTFSFASKTGSRSTRPTTQMRSNATRHVSESFEISVFVDEHSGEEQIVIQDMSGNIRNEPSLLAQAKKWPDYKLMLAEARAEAYQKAVEYSEALIEIYKQTPPLVSMREVEQCFSQLKPQTYIKKEYPIPAPTEAQVLVQLQKQAVHVVNDWKLWSLSKRRKAYIERQWHAFFESEFNTWKQAKDNFDREELKIAETEQLKFLQRYEKEKQNYDHIIRCDKDYIENELADILSSIQLPVEFNIDFDASGPSIHLDLDLPEIEDFPQTKPTLGKSGKFVLKDKSKSELNTDYVRSVIGMAFYFAGVSFNISPGIESIVVTGYTQRLNHATGNIENQYVYEVRFVRELFARLHVKNIDPIAAITQFPHQIQISRYFELNTIKVGGLNHE
jgi:hypothetical protein